MKTMNVTVPTEQCAIVVPDDFVREGDRIAMVCLRTPLLLMNERTGECVELELLAETEGTK